MYLFFVPVKYCFDYCSFIVQSEVRECDSSSLFIFYFDHISNNRIIYHKYETEVLIENLISKESLKVIIYYYKNISILFFYAVSVMEKLSKPLLRTGKWFYFKILQIYLNYLSFSLCRPTPNKGSTTEERIQGSLSRFSSVSSVQLLSCVQLFATP